MTIKINWNVGQHRQDTGVKNCLSELVGEVIATVQGGNKEDDFCILTTVSGKAIKIYHDQHCCEEVQIEDEESDDIVGGVVHFAAFVDGISGGKSKNWQDGYTCTWSFLKIETSKGSIWQRWLGESNGHYSETVDVLGGTVHGH